MPSVERMLYFVHCLELEIRQKSEQLKEAITKGLTFSQVAFRRFHSSRASRN